MTLTYDKRNLENIAKLGDHTKAAALKWHAFLVANKIDILIYETIRTVEDQRANIKKGASQTMRSYHIVGQALDFVPVVKGKADWNGYGRPEVKKALEEAKKLGFEWGGDWKSFIDQPHLQFNYKGYGTDTFDKWTEPKNKPAENPKTEEKVDKPIVPYPGLLKKGAKGKDVERIQRAVGVKPTGNFDSKTEAAVKEYQKRHKLTVDGKVGEKSWNMMF
jgi:peptidoglycan LD-endopeptidase CwlK